MNNEEVAERLYRMAEMLEFKGDNPFKIRAYTNAARNIENLEEDINKIYQRGELEDIPGVGKAIAGKIEEMLTTGTFEAYEKLAHQIPAGITELMKIPGIGPKTVELVHQRLGVETIEDLKKAALEHRIRRLPHMGVKHEEKILRAIERHEERGKIARIPLGKALPIAEEIQEILNANPHIEEAVAAGSLRRRKETVGDIDFIAVSKHPEEAIHAFTHMKKVKDILGEGPAKGTVIYEGNVQVDLRIADRDSFGSMLQHFTGSKEHNIRLRKIALEKGLSLSEYGMTDIKTESLKPCSSEEEEYKLLGLEFIPPELREDRGEIEAALSGNLPQLIKDEDIKGDLHVHSSWSDGNNSIEEWAQAARKLGYEYIAICDHSKSVGIGGGLSEKRLLEQVEEIERINNKFDDIKVLAGTECNIRADGAMDFSNSILSKMDIVIASIHSGFDEDRKKMTKRILSALENEHVDILAHPTGRLLGRRDEYEVDMEMVMEKAREREKILEINAYPSRLDLNDVNARIAKEMGIKMAINTDAHSVKDLKNIGFGVDVARRGWLEKKDVVNTLSLKKLCRLLDIEK